MNSAFIPYWAKDNSGIKSIKTYKNADIPANVIGRGQVKDEKDAWFALVHHNHPLATDWKIGITEAEACYSPASHLYKQWDFSSTGTSGLSGITRIINLQNNTVLLARGYDGVVFDYIGNTVIKETPKLYINAGVSSGLLLDNGKVLLGGGDSGENALLYDMETNTTNSAYNSGLNSIEGLIKLDNGLVFAYSGANGNNTSLYDPVSDTFSAPVNAGSPVISAILLTNGEVLLCLYNGTLRRYNAAANTWGTAISHGFGTTMIHMANIGDDKTLIVNANAFKIYNAQTNTLSAITPIPVDSSIAGIFRIPDNDKVIVLLVSNNGSAQILNTDTGSLTSISKTFSNTITGQAPGIALSDRVLIAQYIAEADSDIQQLTPVGYSIDL